MKLSHHILAIFGCVTCVACVPGKFASRVDGVVIDRETSSVVPGARLVSKIPHRDDRAGAVEVFDITDEGGRFSLGPEFGVFKLLTLDADLREVTISKPGYETRSINITHRDGVRRVSNTNWKELSEMPKKIPLRIELKENKNG
jgi:hypothetical protein